MTRFLIAAAALVVAGAALPAAPAAAVDRPGLAAGSLSVTVHRGFPTWPAVVGGDRTGRFDRRRGFGDVGYLAVPDYQGDSAWRPEGFNDWWHSRPDRNRPGWLRSNNCERMYWTGSGWRC